MAAQKSERERAERARVQGGPGDPSHVPPARIWHPSLWAYLGGFVVGTVALAAGATVIGEVTLLAALAAGAALEWIADRRRLAALRRCRVCGCTDDRSCMSLDFWGECEPCHWVADDLCSNCAPDAEWDAGWGL